MSIQAAAASTPLVADEQIWSRNQDAPIRGRSPRALLNRVRRTLPRGRMLPENVWRRRHRALLGLLWAHVPALLLYGIARDFPVWRSALEAGFVAFFALLAVLVTRGPNPRLLGSALVSLGLLTASAVIVHESGGLIEAHFHFFVMISILLLYEDWVPFLLAFAYVVVHHGAMGTFDSGSVYNHHSAIDHPWRWALIHGVFVVAAGAANVIAWRLNEDVRTELSRAYQTAVAAQVEADEARLALERQNDDLRALDRMKDEFVALVSHELRTPLTSILGYLELIEERPEDLTDDHRHSFEVVNRNATRLHRLVGDLLFIAQVEAGKLTLAEGDLDLRELAADCAEAARPLAEQKSIDLTLECEGPLDVVGDRARLAQVLDNLLSNAIKFTPEGGEVTLRLGNGSEGVTFEVVDSGMGISMKDQAQLFERFFRTAGATEKAIPGSGLGLTIVKAIVEGHGGSIVVESEEGVGTTFRIALPSEAPADALASAPTGVAA